VRGMSLENDDPFSRRAVALTIASSLLIAPRLFSRLGVLSSVVVDLVVAPRRSRGLSSCDAKPREPACRKIRSKSVFEKSSSER
jgi:hypothetical protein